MMPNVPPSRRSFLKTATTASVVANFVPSHVLARSGTTALNDRVQLGVIGIGPRCKYDLGAILPMDDVRCIAMADVQASRRDAGKKLVNEAYGNWDCALYRDLRELLARKSHIACHAAAIAWILKRKLTIDPIKEEFMNDSEANQLRSRPFRNWQS